MDSTNIESGLEVREDASRLPEPYIHESNKEAYAKGPLLDGHYANQNTNPAYGLDVPLAQGQSRSRARICGMGLPLYSFLIALITAIIVGAAVGGGLGGALADAKNRPTATVTLTQTTTMTPTASAAMTTTDGKLVNYTAPLPSAVYSVPLDCPAVDGNTYTARNGQTWAVSCQLDEYTGDIGAVLAYSYQDCIEACAAMNAWQHLNACSRVQFSALMAAKTGDSFGNCWLKNSSAYTTSASTGDLSAKLTSD